MSYSYYCYQDFPIHHMGCNSLAYSRKTKEHMRAPRNMGRLEDATGVGLAGNTGSAFVRVFLRVDAYDRVEKASFEAFVCPTTRAAVSVLTEMVTGKSVRDVIRISVVDLIEEMGDLPVNKTFCAELAIAALRHAADV